MGKGDFSFDEFCRVISEFSSCMDDYPYVVDLKNDKYFISEKALQFCDTKQPVYGCD